MSYNVNEHDRSGRCVRHPEVKLRRRKLFLPGTKYVFKWSKTKRLKYCPCCVMEYVLALDPDVKGQVGLSRKGRLEILMPNATETDDDDDCDISSAASLLQHSDRSSLACQETNKRGQLNSTDARLEENAELVVAKDECNYQDDNSSHHQKPLHQLHSSPTDVRGLHNYLDPDLHDEAEAGESLIDDVIVCKGTVVSLEDTARELTNANEETWISALSCWQKEKEEMTAAMEALKIENRQLKRTVEHMQTSLDFSSQHESRNESIQEGCKEMIHSLRDDIKCASTDQQKGIKEVVSLLQQQVKTLEAEKKMIRAKNEQDVEVLQQEIISLQNSHSETMCMFIKMALEREKENAQALLHKFEIMQESKLKTEPDDTGDHSHVMPNDEVTKEEVFELQKKFSAQKAELEQLRTELANEQRRKEKRKKKKKKSKEKNKGNLVNNVSNEEEEHLPLIEVGNDDFVPLDHDDNEQESIGYEAR